LLFRSAPREEKEYITRHTAPYPHCVRGTRFGRGRKYLLARQDQHCMLLVDFREPPPPSAVAPDVQHACLSVLYLCGYCESANLVEFTAERQGGAVAAGGFGPVLDKHTPPSVHCAPAAFWAEGQNASTPQGRLEIACTSSSFRG
jgi:hypothetical protein